MSNLIIGTFSISVLPKAGPKITSPGHYHPGDWVNLNCTTEQSNPPVRLTWFVNGREVRSYSLFHIENIYLEYFTFYS